MSRCVALVVFFPSHLLCSSGDWTMQGSVRRLAQCPLGVVWSGHIRAALFGPSRYHLFASARTLFSETGVWEKVYQTETRRRVEEWWHPRIMARWRESAEEVRGSFTIHRYFQSMIQSRNPKQKFLPISTCTLSQWVKQKQGHFVVLCYVVLLWIVNGFLLCQFWT